MKRTNKIFLMTMIFFFMLFRGVFAQQQPNVLWILTDDHRYDAVRAFNKMLTGDEMSGLGYVESPSIDRLTQMGTTFVNAYCQAQAVPPQEHQCIMDVILFVLEFMSLNIIMIIQRILIHTCQLKWRNWAIKHYILVSWVFV